MDDCFISIGICMLYTVFVCYSLLYKLPLVENLQAATDEVQWVKTSRAVHVTTVFSFRRRKATIRLSMRWRVSGEQAGSTHVPSQEHWA